MESKEHFLKKIYFANQFINQGYNVELEKYISGNCCVDVYAENKEEIAIVEVIHTSWSGKNPRKILRGKGIKKKIRFLQSKTFFAHCHKAQVRGRPMIGGIYRPIGQFKDQISPEILTLARKAYVQLITDGIALPNWSRIKARKHRCTCKRCKVNPSFYHGLKFTLVFKDKKSGERREKYLSKLQAK